MIRRAFFRGLSLLPFGLSAGALIWTLTLSPFTAPLIDRTAEETARAIDRALARQVTPDWLRTEMEQALGAEDWDRVQTLALIGADVGLAPSVDLMARINALEAAETGFAAQAEDCLICAADVAQCPSLAALGACGLTVELTPVGDLNALRRAAWAGMNGEAVDELDVALAVVGIGATAAVAVTGGTSYTAKAGATVIRVGRRLGSISPPFLRVLTNLADIGLRTDKILPYLTGRVPLDDVVDTARLAGLQDIGGDLTRVYQNTESMAETVRLLRHVDTAEDATKLARASDILGPRTMRTFDVLGKGRVFRAMVRFGDLVIGALGLMAVIVFQLAGVIGQIIGQRLVLRPLRQWAARQAKL